MHAEFLARFEGRASKVTKKGPAQLEQFDLNSLHPMAANNKDFFNLKISHSSISSKRSLRYVKKITEPFENNDENYLHSSTNPFNRKRSFNLERNLALRRNKLEPLPARIKQEEEFFDKSKDLNKISIEPIVLKTANSRLMSEKATDWIDVRLDREALEMLNKMNTFQIKLELVQKSSGHHLK